MTQQLDGAALEEMLRQTEDAGDRGVAANDPSTVNIHRTSSRLEADDGTPAGVVAHRAYLEHQGYMDVYHKKTGDHSYIMRSMLHAQLRKLDEDGNPVFSATPPAGVTPFVGRHRCSLHPDSPDRWYYDQLGVRTTCTREGIPSLQDLEWHLQNRHKREYARYLRARDEEAEDRNRELQQQQLEAQRQANQMFADILEQLQATGEPASPGKPRKEAADGPRG